MTTPRPEERRLGLLQCPNAASRGWNSSAEEAQQQQEEEDDGMNVEAARQEAVEEKTVDEEVKKKCVAFNIEPSESSHGKTGVTHEQEADVDLPQCHRTDKISAVDRSEQQVEVNKSSKAGTDEVERPNKRARTDGPVIGDAVPKIDELASSNVIMTDTMPNQNVPSLADETRQLTTEVTLLEASNGVPNSPSIETAATPDVSQAEPQITAEQPSPSKATTKSAEPLTVSLEYESSCSCLHCTSLHTINDPAESLCTNDKGQILTITYRGCKNEPQCMSLGAISGKAILELLANEACSHDQPEDSTVDLHSKNAPHGLALDIFGYRLSQSNAKSMIINRAEWMNALPLSLICPVVEDGDIKMMLRLRIKSIHDQRNEPSKDSYYGVHPDDSYKLNLYSLGRNDNTTSTSNERKSGVTYISDAWMFTADKIVNDAQSKHAAAAEVATKASTHEQPPNVNRILVCGAKGVGKSTYLRYVTNRILSTTHTRVAVLDLDSGQPEFSPPGLLTLSILTRPIVADPPIHMVCTGTGSCDGTDINGVVEQVIVSYFFGDITSKSDPDTYIHIAKKLMLKYQDFVARDGKCNAIPLIVNTDGWVKGLGYEILSAIVGICNPSHIVQILGNTKAKSFDMSSFHAKEDEGLQPGTAVHVIQSYDEYTNAVVEYGDKRSSLDSQSIVTGTLLATASDHRSHRICAYFLGGSDNMAGLTGIMGDDTRIQFHKEKGLLDLHNEIGLSLASMLPYAVPFHAVKLYPSSGLLDNIVEVGQMWGVRADMASNDILDSLSGAIIGLCYESDLSDLPSIVNCNAGCGTPILPCAGLGIIRSIDTIRRIFYVLSPVHSHLLSKVTSFVGGNIGLPFECVYRGIYSDSFPSLSFVQANPGFGSEVMKSRNHSGRKK